MIYNMTKYHCNEDYCDRDFFTLSSEIGANSCPYCGSDVIEYIEDYIELQEV